MSAPPLATASCRRGAQTGVLAGFDCQAAVWSSKLAATAKSSRFHQEHGGPDGPAVAPGCLPGQSGWEADVSQHLQHQVMTPLGLYR